jgi:hypothetical protein
MIRRFAANYKVRRAPPPATGEWLAGALTGGPFRMPRLFDRAVARRLSRGVTARLIC